MKYRKAPTGKIPPLTANQVRIVRQALDDLYLKIESTTGDEYEIDQVLAVDYLFERVEQEEILKH